MTIQGSPWGCGWFELLGVSQFEEKGAHHHVTSLFPPSSAVYRVQDGTGQGTYLHNKKGRLNFSGKKGIQESLYAEISVERTYFQMRNPA